MALKVNFKKLFAFYSWYKKYFKKIQSHQAYGENCQQWDDEFEHCFWGFHLNLRKIKQLLIDLRSVVMKKGSINYILFSYKLNNSSQ